MKKRAKVHLLPTDDNNSNVIYCQNGRYVKPQERVYQQAMYNGCTRHYIYITTDDEIKEGDWVYALDKVFQITGNTAFGRKIIATTNLSLGLDEVGKAGYSVDEFHPILPQPSKEFIEKYCKAGGIDEVDVEYVTDIRGHWRDNNDEEFERPKVTSNNEIIIHSIEEKMYTKKEVEELCQKAFTHYHDNKMTQGHFEIWKQENLK